MQTYKNMSKYTIFYFLFVKCVCSGNHDVIIQQTEQKPFYCHPKTWEADYYWRDYHGVIPSDAVEGGTDVSGNVTYIGQITIESKVVLPGEIHPGIKMMYVPYGGHRSDDKYVKILCSVHKNEIAWIPTTSDNMHLLTDYKLVVGGYEPPNIVFIGRINYENNVIVGKVSQRVPKGLRIVNPKKEEKLFSTFEVLGFARCSYIFY